MIRDRDVDTEASERVRSCPAATACGVVFKESYDFSPWGCLRFWVLGWPILILFSVLVDAGEREEIFRVWFDGPGRWEGFWVERKHGHGCWR